MPETIDIFLAEDSDDDAAFFLDALEEQKASVRVKVARDGAAALELLFGPGKTETATPLVHPKLIVLDLKLPKVSGLEILRRLKNNPHTHHIPVVILSSSQEKSDVAECYQLGVNSYLVKPLDFDQFGEITRTLAHYWLHTNRAPNR